MLNNIHLWIGAYLRQQAGRLFSNRYAAGPVHVMFCFVDHYEPDHNGAGQDTQKQRVKSWTELYPVLAGRHRDADGCMPKHTFFYPAEVYDAGHLDALAGLCRSGFGEVEVHLHHDNDTAESLRAKLEKAKTDFCRHGLLSRDKTDGRIRYGFIHGNWALNNSRPDGRWCGVNDESRILRETGCYADFTFPSAPSDTQPQRINGIYYDLGCAHKSKSHDHGIDARTGHRVDNGLLIIQGPLALNWSSRKLGIIPRIENSDITGNNPGTLQRIRIWVDRCIGVKGRPEWIFIKVHTHGAPEKNAASLLGPEGEMLYQELENNFNDGQRYVLHYVSAREMFNIIRAAEDHHEGNPGDYRDYALEKSGFFVTR